MKYSIIDVFSRSVTLELTGEQPYYQEEPYEIYVDGVLFGTDRRNVVTVDGLLPSHTYAIKLVNKSGCYEQEITTEDETILLDVRCFGAKGDGEHVDTEMIQAAIYSCPAGGTVRFPKGTYLTAPLFLKSGVTIWLEEGAELLGLTDRKEYPILPGMTIPGMDSEREYNLGSWEGNPLDIFASLITGIDVSDVNIVGRGTINGNAAAGDWWQHKKERIIAWRPRTIFLNRCKNVRIQGIKVCNSPSWTVHPYYCDGLRVMNIRISNPDDSPNTDGFDPESCTDVLLIGTEISVGDDCIAIKSGKYYMSRYHFRRTSGIEIRNCNLMRGHGSVTLGSEAASGVENVRVNKCIFDRTDRGVRIKTRRGRGERSVLDDLVIDNVVMDRVHMPLTVNMFYFCDPDGHSDYVQNQEARPVDEMTPVVGTIRLQNVECRGADASFVCVCGLPERPVEGIILDGVKVSFLPEEERRPQNPVMMDNFPDMSGVSMYLKNVRNVEIKDVEIAGAADAEPTLENVENFKSENLTYKA